MSRMSHLAVALGLATTWHGAPALAAQPVDAERCAAIDADQPRLACYDELFRKAAPADQPATQHAPRQAAATATPSASEVPSTSEAEAMFGLTQAAAVSATQLGRMTSRVVSISQHKTGRPVLSLENGQRWWPVERADFEYFRPGDPIVIRPAAMGSFLAVKEGRARTVRIRRLD